MEKVNLVISRDRLAGLFSNWNYKVGAEIGVERGAYSKVLCMKNPKLHLYCIDPWQAYEGYREHVTQSKLDGFFEETKERLSPYNCTFIREFSGRASLDFEDDSLDFVYIDANHSYENVRNDLNAWVRKVRKGGIVAGHDYIKRKGQDAIFGVIPAVDEFVEKHGIDKLFICRGDKSPSWYFVKK